MDDEDLTAIAAYVRGFGTYGRPIRDCKACTDRAKKAQGCGYVPWYAGKGGVPDAPPAKFHGVCPAWFIRSPWIEGLAELREYKGQLGHPWRDMPARLYDGLKQMEILEAERDVAKMENDARRAERDAADARRLGRR